MKHSALIDMLNRDLTDEHSAILRYLVHAYQEGENTPLGANLLSRCREEMWHMHWLGMIISSLGGEPDMTPAPYPFDPTNRRTILQSYVDYELKLIPHYLAEAEQVDDPHIKRVLQREAWESSIHARKFQRLMDRMDARMADGQPGKAPELSSGLLNRIEKEVSSKYLEMIQHVRSAWVFQNEGALGWQLMDQSMEKMKQLAHLSEIAAENGSTPPFHPFSVERTEKIDQALVRALADVSSGRERHVVLARDGEFSSKAGMVINMDLTLDQEAYQAAEIKDWIATLKK